MSVIDSPELMREPERSVCRFITTPRRSRGLWPGFGFLPRHASKRVMGEIDMMRSAWTSERLEMIGFYPGVISKATINI